VGAAIVLPHIRSRHAERGDCRRARRRRDTTDSGRRELPTCPCAAPRVHRATERQGGSALQRLRWRTAPYHGGQHYTQGGTIRMLRSTRQVTRRAGHLDVSPGTNDPF